METLVATSENSKHDYYVTYYLTCEGKTEFCSIVIRRDKRITTLSDLALVRGAIIRDAAPKDKESEIVLCNWRELELDKSIDNVDFIDRN